VTRFPEEEEKQKDRFFSSKKLIAESKVKSSIFSGKVSFAGNVQLERDTDINTGDENRI